MVWFCVPGHQASSCHAGSLHAGQGQGDGSGRGNQRAGDGVQPQGPRNGPVIGHLCAHGHFHLHGGLAPGTGFCMRMWLEECMACNTMPGHQASSCHAGSLHDGQGQGDGRGCGNQRAGDGIQPQGPRHGPVFGHFCAYVGHFCAHAGLSLGAKQCWRLGGQPVYSVWYVGAIEQ